MGTVCSYTKTGIMDSALTEREVWRTQGLFHSHGQHSEEWGQFSVERTVHRSDCRNALAFENPAFEITETEDHCIDYSSLDNMNIGIIMSDKFRHCCSTCFQEEKGRGSLLSLNGPIEETYNSNNLEMKLCECCTFCREERKRMGLMEPAPCERCTCKLCKRKPPLMAWNAEIESTSEATEPRMEIMPFKDDFCGLCDFFTEGCHDNWNGLDEDIDLVMRGLETLKTNNDRGSVKEGSKKRVVFQKADSGTQHIVIEDESTSYHIEVANPPEDQEIDEENIDKEQEPVSTQSGTVVVRRMHPRGGALMRGVAQEKDEAMEGSDSKLEGLTRTETTGACDKAASRLREIAHHLQHGDVPISVLQKTLQYAICVLETVSMGEASLCVVARKQTTGTPANCSPIRSNLISSKKRSSLQSTATRDSTRRLTDDEDELSEVQPDAVPNEVRDWLASTFTRHAAAKRRRSDDKPRFRSVANAIRAGIMVDKIYRRMSSSAVMQIPNQIAQHLKNIDDWNFDVFSVNKVANGQVLRYVATDLLNRYGLVHKFKIPVNILENLLIQVELGYCKYKNPYHNNIHAADVTQTVHYMLCQGGLAAPPKGGRRTFREMVTADKQNWLTDLEVFATLFAAIIHDFEHTGTTNNFHVMSGSDTAMLYNDRAVLENHHISAAFRLMMDEGLNILQNLSKEEYRDFRSLVIEMVLGTDMSSHFQQIKTMKSLLSLTEFNIDKAKALSLILHSCDISHPSKQWMLHYPWTKLLMEEFFQQGDKEQELGLPFSPLCDRNTTLIAESQIGFIDFIVYPSMEVLGDLLSKIQLTQAHANRPIEDSISEENESKTEPKHRTKSMSSIQTKRTHSTTLDSTNSSEVGVKTKHSMSTTCSSSLNSGEQEEIRWPWISHLDKNKSLWQERANKDAELKALEAVQKSSSENQEDETSHPLSSTSEK
ncbi:putative 3',5'-cyclic phosphodiesterase pde-1 isoform X2 [Tachypleus tridentatus]|uniref:putative 3',5'-cyclic phosphodiesterase pde-1 isoform X2 n=1 Tax=Tachypleus tridentatus TaxID=6853 RepID=UPI003FD1909C